MRTYLDTASLQLFQLNTKGGNNIPDMKAITALVLLLLVCMDIVPPVKSCFVIDQATKTTPVACERRTSATSILCSTRHYATTPIADKLDKDSTSGLRFAAASTYRSKDVPLPNDMEQDIFASFFSTKNNNHHLLTKGTRNNVQTLDSKEIPKHMKQWIEEAERMGAAKPDLNDSLLSLSVRTPFLVFVLNVSATLGAKLLWHPFATKEGGRKSELLLPEYQFLLLDQTFRADGPPPLVFIFDQLTGINKKVRGTYRQPNHALFQVTAEPSPDGKHLSFMSRMNSELNIRFPKILLKLLPVPKERIEKEGSTSLQNNMERDVPPGVDLFQEAYSKWLGRHRANHL